MHHHHPAGGLLSNLLAPGRGGRVGVLDSARQARDAQKTAAAKQAESNLSAPGEQGLLDGTQSGPAEGANGAGTPAAQVEKGTAGLLDAAGDGSDVPAADYLSQDISVKAAAAVQQWVETDDLDEGESLADRLRALLVGIADDDQNGELDDDELEIVGMACDAAWDYLASLGVSDDDLSALLEEWDGDAADRVQELLAGSLGDGEDAMLDSANQFAFAGSDEAEQHLLDATYRRVVAVRKGQRVHINKRISGVVRLTARQKVAIRKMIKRSHSAKAQMGRARSMRVRRKVLGA